MTDDDRTTTNPRDLSPADERFELELRLILATSEQRRMVLEILELSRQTQGRVR
jgi:hypothetical protein